MIRTLSASIALMEYPMPWTRKQVKKLLGPDSPLTPEQQQKMKSELANDPSLGHARKGSKALKRGGA
jgi:hypothetical protein